MTTAKDITALRLGRAHTAALTDMLNRIEALERSPDPAPAPVPVPAPTPPPAPAPVPAPVVNGLHAAHFMLAFVKSFWGDLPAAQAYVRGQFEFARANGQNGAFLFCDNPVGAQFDPGEGERYEWALQLSLDLAASLGDFRCIPMIQPVNATPAALVYWWQKFGSHPAVLRVNGVPAFAFWNWKPATGALVTAARQASGLPVHLVACFDWWELMGPDRAAGPVWDNSHTWERLDLLIAEHPECDGWLNFVVGGSWDQGAVSAVPQIVGQNASLAKFCPAAGKTFWPGWAARYGTLPGRIMTDDGLRAQWDSILAGNGRTATLSTANDETEISGINHPADQHFHDVVRAQVTAFLNRA